VFAWAALATGVLVGVGVLVLALVNGSVQFNEGSGGATSAPSSSATSTPSGSASAGSDASEQPGGTATETPAPAAGASPSDQGATTLVVLNGTSTTGLAANAATKLGTAGWTVTSTGDAGTTGSTQTVVYYQQESQAALAQGIAQSLGTSAVQQSAAFPNADVSVVLGSDYAG
jgi:hypothetical protein